MKSFFLILLSFIFFSFCFNDFGYQLNINTVFVKNFVPDNNIFLSLVSSDSTKPVQDVPSNGLTDIANMFNERGYYKSNASSLDEQEIINDFNGNLMYNIPLFNYSLAGDINFNLSLNYNGSVGHQIFVGDSTSYNNGTFVRLNMNSPEWIINLNGIAVQTLNFETSFFTNDVLNHKIIGDSIKSLIPGYHFDGSLEAADASNPNNRIEILAGDGSLITLVNKTENVYVGTYLYEGKELYYKAEVSFAEEGSDGYRKRLVKFMRGDGAEFIFKEYKRNYYDFDTTAIVTVRRKPMMLLLDEIKDSYGHFIKLWYDIQNIGSNDFFKKGRPLLDSITAYGYSNNNISIKFLYSPSGNLVIQNTLEVNETYKLFFSTTPVNFGETGNKTGYIERILNPLGQQDTIKNELYKRTFTDVYANLNDPIVDIIFSKLKRIKNFRDYLRGRNNYNYSLNGQPTDNLSVSNSGQINNRLRSNPTYYKGYGRDAFYTNMLGNKTDSNNLKPNSNTSFYYDFIDNVSNSDKIDSSDKYISVRSVFSLDPQTINYSYDSIATYREYRIYPLYNSKNIYVEAPDIQGITKLILDSSYYFIAIQLPSFDKNYYHYEIDSVNILDTTFMGSFLILSKLNYRNKLARLWSYSYTYKDGQYDSVLTSSTETDPLLNGNRTTYDNFYKTGLVHKRMSNYLNEVNSDAFYDTSIYYKTQVPKSEERLNQNSQVISSITYEYIQDENDNKGYYGQLRNKKQHNNKLSNEFILTEFEYYKGDFSGNLVYTGDFYPYKEGNIKLIRNPNGEITKYFYTPQTQSEVEQPSGVIPRLKFKIKYNSNATADSSEDIWDGRFPIRTDSYKENGVSTDTLSISYKSYSVDGSPAKIIGWNKYTSDINYEPVHRVSSVILPGDFTPDTSTFTIKYNYNNVNNFIYVLSYRNTLSSQYSKVKYSIDGFANVKEKDVFTSDTDSNSFKYSFNYMNKPADNTDAMGNTTELSYDGLARLIRTNNADGSQTFNSYTYQNTLSNYFGGTYNGFIEKQVYTDEEAHHFEKYFDAVGNLLQELSYTYEIPSDIKTGEPDVVLLITNYQYDSLYRLTKVQTPEGKFIYYSYDGYGRQSQRTTPDAGLTTYTYDKNSNLTFSQDANQRYADVNKFSFRNYDGINRLTGVGENVFIPDSPSDGGQFVPTDPDLYLTLNVYDTLSNDFVNIFFPPADYYSRQNFTKGNLAATAYRTRITDNWSYKYYRYDERGRVIKVWNTIYGQMEKGIMYDYNSQDQVTHVNYGDDAEYKRFSYYYDYAGRLGTLNYANADPSIFIEVIDKSAPDINFSSFTYNPNSLLDFQFFNSSRLQNQYRYNNRNWVTEMNNVEGQFGYTNTYFKNGNLETQLLTGTYKDYMQNRYNLNYKFSYDYSNRLLNAQNINQGDNTYSTYNTYDKDGNITTLKRYGDNNALKDNFVYAYSPGTNKTIRVSGAADQFSYDHNGNTILDDLNGNYNILYDHRNLITELYHNDPSSETPYTIAARYYYDESGNRVRKLTYYNTQQDPLPVLDWNNLKNPGNGWQLSNNEFYVKGTDGKDLAIYEGQQLQEWYVWGNDLAGKLRGDKAYYYYKDHLGSVRAVVDNTGAIVAGFDYDAWGYPLENRNYNGDSIKYKYTGKELDKESFYDYFGSRYYDSRIGRWGTPDMENEKALGWTPYRAFFDNPLLYTDPNGKFEFPQAKEYPRLAQYLQSSIQSITKNFKIMKALELYSGLTKDQLNKAFEWGKGPTITVTQLEGSFGEFTLGSGSEELRIDVDLVNLLENADENLADVYLFLTGVTILHELTHYGVDKTGYGYSDIKTLKAAEHGNFFEKSAYGEIINSYVKATNYMNSYNERKKLAKRYYPEYFIDETNISP